MDGFTTLLVSMITQACFVALASLGADKAEFKFIMSFLLTTSTVIVWAICFFKGMAWLHENFDFKKPGSHFFLLILHVLLTSLATWLSLIPFYVPMHGELLELETFGRFLFLGLGGLIWSSLEGMWDHVLGKIVSYLYVCKLVLSDIFYMFSHIRGDFLPLNDSNSQPPRPLISPRDMSHPPSSPPHLPPAILPPFPPRIEFERYFESLPSGIDLSQPFPRSHIPEVLLRRFYEKYIESSDSDEWDYPKKLE